MNCVIIISVSELFALVNSEKIRDRGLCNKLVTGVLPNIAAGLITMFLTKYCKVSQCTRKCKFV